jgi:hypothetical protein
VANHVCVDYAVVQRLFFVCHAERSVNPAKRDSRGVEASLPPDAVLEVGILRARNKALRMTVDEQ